MRPPTISPPKRRPNDETRDLHPSSGGSSLAVDFDREIRPLLQERCIECHGEKKQKGELRLDAKSFALKGGHDGPAIIAGNLQVASLPAHHQHG
jgi:hypothetical protein